MSYREVAGNIFNSQAQALVNTVNCVGAMGKGIALEFRRRYPTMFLEYREVCSRGELRPGEIWRWSSGERQILNCAVKNHWKYPSKPDWIERCLEVFSLHYIEWGIQSIAFPWMGAMNGGIPLEVIQTMMRFHLKNLPSIQIEVYEFSPDAKDPLFEKLLKLSSGDITAGELSLRSGISKVQWEKTLGMLQSGTVPSLTKLIEAKAFGAKSIEKLYLFLGQSKIVEENSRDQLGLF